MIKCPGCGEENPPKFRLCGYCGTALSSAPPPPALPVRELRKTVTIVFSDLKDSTALGESIDTEALHEVKERYFSTMAAEIKRHGGKIEKYIGDAIMAVFGLPRANEDDALRAVRAAQGMRRALEELNDGLRQRYGVALANRTGVNTGEVVANDDPTADQKLATGDAVNVAARLEQAAPVNEIYIGETTWRLVRDAVEAESVEPLALKGKTERIPAYRLISATGQDGNVRRIDTPLAGRDAELKVLVDAWNEVRTERVVRLVTVVGDAGLGKSRLIHELIHRHAERATVLRGRCLPYGDGITFWPLVEMASALLRTDDTQDKVTGRLTMLTGDEEVARRIGSVIGLSKESYPLHEINWAARRFLEHLATQQPVIAIVDDIHWAEPAFLSLLEHVLDTVAQSPILLICGARPDLNESHAGWPNRPNAVQLPLQPLNSAAAQTVVRHLLGQATLPPRVVERIVQAAEGNPLYVEQMLSMLIDSRALQHDDESSGLAGMAGLADQSGDEILVPPTIRALLEARLDRLARSERATVEPAAVIGVEFEQQAVASLLPEALRPAAHGYLEALRTKQFIEPSRGRGDDPLFRFHHHLIRDTVYNGLLKRARANLHIAFVQWADKVNEQREHGLEWEEILGYHLEQAYRNLSDLGPLDAQGKAIGRDAASRLGAAGQRAFARGDMHAAASLFRRAVAMFARGDAGQLELLPALGEALMELGDFDAARTTLEQAAADAEQASMPRLAAAAGTIRLLVRLYSGETCNWNTETARLSDEIIPVLQTHGAHDELAQAWRLIALSHQLGGRLDLAAGAIERVIEHARAASNQRLVARSSLGLSFIGLYGRMPAEQAISQCEEVLASGLKDRQVVSLIQCKLAQLYAMRKDFDRARSLLREGRSSLRELGQGVHAASTALDLAVVEWLGGDRAHAEREVRRDYEFLKRQGETFYLSTMASLLARLVREDGRDDEVLLLTDAARDVAADDDADAQVLWRATRAPVVAKRGDLQTAEALAREAIKLARTTEIPVLQADALNELGSVLAFATRETEAKEARAEALDLYLAKGDLVSVDRTRALLQQLG